jgi:hypothetical protein
MMLRLRRRGLAETRLTKRFHQVQRHNFSGRVGSGGLICAAGDHFAMIIRTPINYFRFGCRRHRRLALRCHEADARNFIAALRAMFITAAMQCRYSQLFTLLLLSFV